MRNLDARAPGSLELPTHGGDYDYSVSVAAIRKKDADGDEISRVCLLSFVLMERCACVVNTSTTATYD